MSIFQPQIAKKERKKWNFYGFAENIAQKMDCECEKWRKRNENEWKNGTIFEFFIVNFLRSTAGRCTSIDGGGQMWMLASAGIENVRIVNIVRHCVVASRRKLVIFANLQIIIWQSNIIKWELKYIFGCTWWTCTKIWPPKSTKWTGPSQEAKGRRQLGQNQGWKCQINTFL